MSEKKRHKSHASAFKVKIGQNHGNRPTLPSTQSQFLDSLPPKARQGAYPGLFESPIHSNELDLIRSSLQSGTPLGNERFKQQIASIVGCSVGFNKRGRPSKY
ncbi:MAG: hypothetical protein RI993_2190 [Pseudomonadota bacterium]|jgi:hypothetical protein